MEPLSGPQRNSRLLPPSEALNLLRDLEQRLVELRSIGAASYRRRLDIEAELSTIRHDLHRWSRGLDESLELGPRHELSLDRNTIRVNVLLVRA